MSAGGFTVLRRALVLTAALALLLACASGAQARPLARAAEVSLGPAPEQCTGANYEFGGCIVQTRLGTLSVSPHVVHAGGVLTATVALTGEYPISWPDVTASPSGSFAPGLTQLHECGAHATTCEWKVGANTPSSTSWQFLQVGITNNQGTGISREYFAIIGKDEFELSGKVLDSTGAAVGGVKLDISGTQSTSATTNAAGEYSAILKRGSYEVAPVLAKHVFSPQSRHVTLDSNQVASFTELPNIDQVTVSVEQPSVVANGLGISPITITDTNPLGEPVENETIKISPPLGYEVPAIMCDSTGRLVYPTLLSDGSALGSSFQLTTDGAGQIHLTTLFGTVPGDWLIEAGEASAPLSQYGHGSVTLTPSGGSGELPDALTSLLIAAAEHNLANLTQEPLHNILAWLGRVQGEIGGIGFLPIHSVDATGKAQAGVVLYANTPAVREDVLDYLDGRSTNPPGEAQAVVIDIASVSDLRIGSTLAGHPTDQVPYRLPSIDAWANGTTIVISEKDQGNFGQEGKIPIPARGRPSFGFPSPTGAESLLYGYGPYPPATAPAAEQSVFNRCVAHDFSTSITPHSPVTVTARDSKGQTSGLKGAVASAGVPGSIVSHKGSQLTGLSLPEGSYSLQVTGTGSGPATLVLAVEGPGGLSTKVFHFSSRRGGKGTISVHGSGISSTMRFAGHTVRASAGVKLSVRGLPGRLKKGHASALKLTVREQFGHAAGQVTVRVSGVAGKHLAGSSGGHVALTLKPTRRGHVKLVFSGPGLAPLTRIIAVK